jgi:hypothetical protein
MRILVIQKLMEASGIRLALHVVEEFFPRSYHGDYLTILV